MQSYEDSKKISGFQGWVGKDGEVNRQSIQDFWSSETALYGIIMMDISHCTFVQTSRMYNTKNQC